MSSINQKQTLKLQQKLSPQQIQMVKLLELPTMLLEQRVKQEIEENPILEEDVFEDKPEEEEEVKNISVDDYLKDDYIPSYKLNANNYSKDEKSRPFFLSGGRTLHEYLTEQLGFKNLSPKEDALAKYLIGSIDTDGYLRIDMQSIVNDLAFRVGIDVSVEELEQVLAIIQELEPAGIGARNLQECLLLQLKNESSLTLSQDLAKKILKSYFEEFSKKHYEKLYTRLNIGQDELRDAIEEITRLTPRPGTIYNDSSEFDSPYIVPDFTLDYVDGQFDFKLNSHRIPEVKVSSRYIDMIRSISSSSKNKQDQDTMRFIKSKIDSAKWFISAIKQRQDTLTSTFLEILNYQKEYFIDGNKSNIRPMILKDIADRTGFDISTISRVVNNKYVQTHFGILLLKELFSEGMQTDSGEEVSSYEIKNIILDCIENEDKQKPLTDNALMDILNNKGYLIARRTVAKYRELLKIPVARLRKEL